MKVYCEECKYFKHLANNWEQCIEPFNLGNWKSKDIPREEPDVRNINNDCVDFKEKKES
uniref:Uncharacterized protein n=1 Tax=viral metagenome TaxID=1070528 RepID=A0A6M3LDP8_9ZZZZ